jgi:hypothetical protein
MKDWTVSGSSDFDLSKNQHFADFDSRLNAHDDSPKTKSAKRLLKEISGFRHLLGRLTELLDVNNRSVLPENELAYIQDDSQGNPIYSMIDGDWRCLFWVDTKNGICTAAKVELMFDNLRVVEEDRHQHGKKLPSLR